MLTTRESQIVALLARDTQAKEIAAALGTSVHTVRNQIEALYKKLGVHSRMAALITVGFLTLPPVAGGAPGENTRSQAAP